MDRERKSHVWLRVWDLKHTLPGRAPCFSTQWPLGWHLPSPLRSETLAAFRKVFFFFLPHFSYFYPVEAMLMRNT